MGSSLQKSFLNLKMLLLGLHWEYPSNTLQCHQHRRTCRPMQPILSDMDYEWVPSLSTNRNFAGYAGHPKLSFFEQSHRKNILMLHWPQSKVMILRCGRSTLCRCSAGWSRVALTGSSPCLGIGCSDSHVGCRNFRRGCIYVHTFIG